MFRVGDKVTCLCHGKGVVFSIGEEPRPIEVSFGDYSIDYTDEGMFSLFNTNKVLYHGHGTFKIEFIEDKEPEYKWQWLYLDNDGLFQTSGYFKTENLMRDVCKPKIIVSRIEESKREVKHG